MLKILDVRYVIFSSVITVAMGMVVNLRGEIEKQKYTLEEKKTQKEQDKADRKDDFRRGSAEALQLAAFFLVVQGRVIPELVGGLLLSLTGLLGLYSKREAFLEYWITFKEIKEGKIDLEYWPQLGGAFITFGLATSPYYLYKGLSLAYKSMYK